MMAARAATCAAILHFGDRQVLPAIAGVLETPAASRHILFNGVEYPSRMPLKGPGV
ncbi:hypothetical protein H2509_07690 [Stappia sp. F7233]|uniref:Uncharacterized protein n=1 Tax=Stappia albiluteola TaxID=2758565 RepID=A0A839AC40_9HYPH|nr:hypothetical protein [Stappia albiluteola]